jgi:hypothetical protein
MNVSPYKLRVRLFMGEQAYESQRGAGCFFQWYIVLVLNPVVLGTAKAPTQ